MKRPSSQSRQPAASPVYEGYQRVRLFDRRLVEFALLVVLVLVGAIYFFPRHKVLVHLYLQRGLAQEALVVIDDMLRQRPEDIELMLLRADALQQADEPDSALAQLEQVVRRDPQNREALGKRVQYSQWNRDLSATVRALDDLLAADPLDRAALRRLWEYCAYLSLTDKETETVLRLVHLEKGLPLDAVYPPVMDAADADRLMQDPLPRIAMRTLQRLAFEHRSMGPDPLRDELLRLVFSLRANYLWLWERSPIIGPPDPDVALVNFLEAFLRTDQPAAALVFADQLDAIWTQRPKAKLALLAAMQRFKLDQHAAALAAELGEQYADSIEIQLELAVIAHSSGNLAAAARALEKVAAMRPDSLIDRWRIVDLYLEMGDPLTAYQSIHRLAADTELTPDLMARVMEVAGYTGKPEPAEQTAAMVQRLSPPNPDLMLKAVQLLVAAGRLHGAIAMIEAYGVLRPNDAKALAQQARLYQWTEQPAKAYAVYKQMAATGMDGRGALENMLAAAEASGNPALIREAAQVVGRSGGGDPVLLIKAADALVAAGDVAGGAGVYRRYLQRRSADRRAAEKLAQLYLWQGQYVARARLLAGLADAEPGNAAGLLAAGQAFIEAGQVAEAVGYLEKAMALKPGDDELRRQIAVYYGWGNLAHKAAPLLAQIADQDPADVDKAMAAAEAWAQVNQLAKAIGHLERSARLRPDYARLWEQLATFNGWIGAVDQKAAALEKLVRLQPLSAEHRLVLAQSYIDRQMPQAAIGLLAPPAQAKTLSPEALLVLATAYQQAGRNDQSGRIFKQLAKDHAGDPTLLADLGSHALWAGRLDQALEFFLAALKKEPRNGKALKGSAQIYAWNNDAARAIAQFEAYNRLVPDDHEARFQLGELYTAHGRHAQAMGQYDKTLSIIRQISPSPVK
jgi:tetratricopeptide (TPR) repeat protein